MIGVSVAHMYHCFGQTFLFLKTVVYIGHIGTVSFVLVLHYTDNTVCGFKFQLMMHYDVLNWGPHGNTSLICVYLIMRSQGEGHIFVMYELVALPPDSCCGYTLFFSSGDMRQTTGLVRGDYCNWADGET